MTTSGYEIIGRSWSSQVEAREIAHACGKNEPWGADPGVPDPIMASKTIPKIPHDDYRVLVTAAAIQQAKLHGGRSVETRDHAAGKMIVDKMLVEKGLGVEIPCAKPGRITR